MGQDSCLRRTVYLLDLQSMAVRNPFKRTIQRYYVKKMLQIIETPGLDAYLKKQFILNFLEMHVAGMNTMLTKGKKTFLSGYEQKVLHRFRALIDAC